jgi:hypothetical protein
MLIVQSTDLSFLLNANITLQVTIPQPIQQQRFPNGVYFFQLDCSNTQPLLEKWKPEHPCKFHYLQKQKLQKAINFHVLRKNPIASTSISRLPYPPMSKTPFPPLTLPANFQREDQNFTQNKKNQK